MRKKSLVFAKKSQKYLVGIWKVRTFAFAAAEKKNSEWHLRKSSLKELHKQRSSSTRSDWFTFLCYQLGRRNEPSLCCFTYSGVIRETF